MNRSLMLLGLGDDDQGDADESEDDDDADADEGEDADENDDRGKMISSSEVCGPFLQMKSCKEARLPCNLFALNST